MFVAAAYPAFSSFRLFPTGLGSPLLSSFDDRALFGTSFRRLGL
jgi:hypothetical protein